MIPVSIQNPNPPRIPDHNFTKFVDYEEVRPYLNGYVRILEFEVVVTDDHSDYNPTLESDINRLKLDLLFMTEGMYFNGSANGFARRFYQDKLVEVGFWEDSIPWGKF